MNLKKSRVCKLMSMHACIIPYNSNNMIYIYITYIAVKNIGFSGIFRVSTAASNATRNWSTTSLEDRRRGRGGGALEGKRRHSVWGRELRD